MREPVSMEAYSSRFLRVDEEVQEAKMLCEIVEGERGVVFAGIGGVQVMDAELVEVTDDDGVRPLGVRHRIRMGLRLLERGNLAVLAGLGLVRRNAEGLLAR